MTMTANNNISTQYCPEDKALVVQFYGGHRGIASRDFTQNIKNELSAAITNNDIKTVILDLNQLNNISSEGLGILLLSTKYLKEKQVKDSKVIITNPNESVMRVIKITQLDTILDIQQGSSEDILRNLQSESK